MLKTSSFKLLYQHQTFVDLVIYFYGKISTPQSQLIWFPIQQKGMTIRNFAIG